MTRTAPVSIGLTGGIASGKSTVAAVLAELGAIVIDADALAHQAVAPGTEGLAEIEARFGAEVINADGGLDRAALGVIVFADETEREALNAIIHPRVREAARAVRERADADDVVVEDIPLLVETGQADRFELVVVVQAEESARIQRMVDHRGMTDDDARSRLRAQASDAERAAVADVVLRNEGTVEELRARTEQLWRDTIEPLRSQ
ncbi:MAG: dephospho-CoA kinase [Micrococcaceae bacterium]